MSANSDNIYQQIVGEVKRVAQHLGMDIRLSDSMALAITLRLQKLFGNNTVYFPRLASPEERRAAIRRDFDGKNHNEVCKKHGISRSTLYRAIGARRESSSPQK